MGMLEQNFPYLVAVPNEDLFIFIYLYFLTRWLHFTMSDGLWGIVYKEHNILKVLF